MELKEVITTDLLKTVFEDYFKREINVLNFTILDMQASGGSFCSEVRRVRLSYLAEDDEQVRTISAIAKFLPQNEVLKEILKEMKLFDCETKMYSLVMPRFSEFAYGEKFTPHVYYNSMEPRPLILLQDLSTSGYEIMDRRNGLAFNYCLAAVEKLAYFHAASRILHEEDPSFLVRFNQTILGQQKWDEIMSICYDEVVKLCQKLEDLNGYVEKLKFSKDQILSGIRNVHKTDSKFKVLNHGDFWTNNILFRCNQDGNVEDVKLIDLQGSCFASPWFDLHFFLAASVNSAVRPKQDAIVNHYFHTLVNRLEKLRAKTLPIREDFDEDFRLMSYYGFACSICGRAFMSAAPKEGASIQSFLEDETTNGYRYHCFNSERYLKEVLHYIPFYDRIGFFNLK